MHFLISLLLLSQLEFFEEEFQVSSFISTRFFYRFNEKSDFVSPYTLANRLYSKLSVNALGGKMNLSGDFYYKTSFTQLSQYVVPSIQEAYFQRDFGTVGTKIGMQKNSWGKTDLSPIDILNPPNLSELFFNDIEVMKVPTFQILVEFPLFDGISSEIVYEPFFEPAFLPSIFSEWSTLIGTEDRERIETLRSMMGDIRLNIKKPVFPSSSQFGGSIYSKRIGLYFFYGLEYMPPPNFEQGLRGSLASQEGSLSEKLRTLTAEELAEPILSVNRPPMELVPSRYIMIGVSFDEEFGSVSLKSDVAFFSRRQFLNEKFEVEKNPQLQISLQAERFIGKHFLTVGNLSSIVFVGSKIPEKNYRFLGQRALSTNLIVNLLSRWRQDFLTYLTLLVAPQDEWGYVIRFQVEKEMFKIKFYPGITIFGNLGGKDSDIGSLKNKSFIMLWMKYYIM